MIFESVVFAGTGAILPIPVELIVAVLGIVVTVLTLYGALIKYLYDGHTTLDQLLRGANGDDGFIKETREAHKELSRSQREIERTLRAHGALLQELVFTLHKVAENMDDDEQLDELDTRRLEHLEETLREKHDMAEESPKYGTDTESDYGESDDK